MIETFETNTILLTTVDFFHLRTSKLLSLCLRTSKIVNWGEFVSCYSEVSLVLKIYKEITLCLQFMVLFVEIVYIFFVV